MSGLRPVAFDIETSGLSPESVITVAGLCFNMGSWLGLNTGGRDADAGQLEIDIETDTGTNVNVAVCPSEDVLLAELADCAKARLTDGQHYLTAFNGEVWNGGFDLPFLRSACARHDIAWPFETVPYADTMEMVSRFETGEESGLEHVYETLLGDEHCDPFDESEEAVTAYENGNWRDLLLHNLADIQRTREIAILAGRYIPKSDFRMKSLAPPDV